MIYISAYLLFYICIVSNQPKLKLDYPEEDGELVTRRIVLLKLHCFIGILYMGPIMGLSVLPSSWVRLSCIKASPHCKQSMKENVFGCFTIFEHLLAKFAQVAVNFASGMLTYMQVGRFLIFYRSTVSLAVLKLAPLICRLLVLNSVVLSMWLSVYKSAGMNLFFLY